MDEKKICFIMCSNDDFLAEECILYINQLHIPKGYRVDTVVVKDAKSMCSGYNEAMNYSDAKYKIYLHQDLLIIHRNFIYDILKLFEKDENIGMIGLVGNTSMAADGGTWSDGQWRRIGECYADLVVKSIYSFFGKAQGDYQETVVVDGMLMATQYDMEWREDLFGGWDYYDCSQAMEFWKKGYKVVVPYMENPWCLHDNDLMNLSNYEKWRQIFKEEYYELYMKWNEEHGRKEMVEG